MRTAAVLDPSEPDPGRRVPLAVTAYGRIYRKIITLEYEPGRRLEEKALMEELGLGRTPIREALAWLATDFMVQAHPGKGYEVRPITLQNTKAAFAALRILELGVAELAVRQDVTEFLPAMADANRAVADAVRRGDVLGLVDANNRFHHAFSLCSRNDYLVSALHKIRCETNRLAYLSFNNEIDPLRSLSDHYRSVVDHHDRVIRCVADRDGEELARVVTVHVEAFQKRIVLYLAT